MATITFDSLSASKRLREAGMDQRVAETVVELFQQSAGMPDISDLATKDDLKQLELATKADIRQLEESTKADIRQLEESTKADIRHLEQSTKAEIQETKLTLRMEIAQTEARLSEKIRTQGWAIMGGMAALLAINTALAKLIG